MTVLTQVPPKTPVLAASLTTRSPLLQRKCACGGTPGADGECAACKAKRLGLQRRATGAGDPSGVPPIVHDVLRSSGQPLDAGTRAFMGQKFGHDFSRVRVHTDARAAESAMAVRASAYTVGERVVFGAKAYEPGSHQGRRLLAHELTHVVQQQGPVGANPTVVSNDLGAEREADEAANRIDYPGDAVSSQVKSTVSSAGVHRFAPSPGSPLTPGQIAELDALVEEFTALVSSGGVAAEEAAAVEVVVAEAEAAIVAAGEVAAAGTALIAAGETATIGAGALAADDVTGIGVADDVAIPFVLLGAAAMFGLGYLVGNSAAEIAAAWTKAADAVARAVKLIQQAVRRARPQPQTQTKTETQTQTEAAPKTQTTERDRSPRCRVDPCDHPLPISWPAELPYPTLSPRTLMRTSRGDREWEGIERGEPQRTFAEDIARARNRLVPPPNPCFEEDAEPNTPYDAHHAHPLYLGGEDSYYNLCAVETRRHMRGHVRLDNQSPWLAEYMECGICSPLLKNHPIGQTYEIVGDK